jgi:beta-glucanase (GH16 family)
MRTGFALMMLLLVACSSSSTARDRDNPQSYRYEPLDLSEWELSWSDEFDYDDAQLDENWASKSGEFESEWVLGRRWRKNAVVMDGVLELRNIKDEQDPHVWSSASVWTKDSFGYGYYEARYKYAGAYGTNNSFWFWPEQGTPEGQKACEIDVNEGHYPNIMNTNIHNWTDTWITPSGREAHHDNQLHHTLFGEPEHTIALDASVLATKVRLRSDNPASIHVREFRVLSNGENLSLADDAVFTTVGVFNRLPSKEEYAVDGNPDTRWVSAKHGPKWLQLEWPEPQSIDSIELLNGWPQSDGAHRNLIGDYTVEVYDGESWHELASYDASTVADFSEEFHTFGLEWSEDWFKWYLDGELFYTLRNDVCFSDVSILLSMAILNFEIAGPVTDAINGTSMKVDYVRYYTRRGEAN